MKSGSQIDSSATTRILFTEKSSRKKIFPRMIGESEKIKKVFSMIDKVCDSDTAVLIQGESGTGKELIAKALHYGGVRKKAPFIPVNCGAIPADLLESELFGHEKGAFTHAIRSRQGRFELADGGPVFLDEIGEMSPMLQVKILRVLQEKEFERIGGTKTIKSDFRVIAATNRILDDEVKKGRFREDLYYRLTVLPISAPPLRERVTDIPLLADYFLAKGPMEKMAKHIGRLLDKIEKGTTVPPSDKTVFNPGNLISRQISHELIQTVDFHQAINQSIGLGILVIDRDARIIAVNPMAFEILNKSINDVLERQIINIFPEKEKQKVLGALKKLLLEPHMRRIVFFATINSHTVRVIVSLLRIDGEIAGYILALEETSEWVEQV